MEVAPHPARYNDAILDVFAGLVKPGWRILDPMAGVGGIHQLAERCDVETVGLELEPEWACAHPRTMVGNALSLPFPDDSVDCICVSCCYGNRMADHHDAKDKSKRITYTHLLGRKLHPDNSGAMQWGNAYRDMHIKAWKEAIRVLRPEGIFVLNVKDHIRKGRIQHVVEWHIGALESLGLKLGSIDKVFLSGMGFGENHDVRVDHEVVAVLSRSFIQQQFFTFDSSGLCIMSA